MALAVIAVLITSSISVRIGFEPNGKDIIKNSDDLHDIHGLHQEDSPLDTSSTRIPAGSVGVIRSGQS